MRKQSFKHIAQGVAASACMLLLLTSCMSNAEKTFGRGGLENANVVANVLDDVGVYEKKKDPVDYSERPPLDIPNSTDKLPTPKQDPQTEYDDVSDDDSADSQSESPDSSDQVAKIEEQQVQSEQQITDLTESANEISQNESSDSTADGSTKTSVECELYPENEDIDCHLIQPPDEYN